MKRSNIFRLVSNEFIETGICLGEALVELGVAARDKVGIIADHRLEWVISDAGILMTGAANVPRGTDVTESELEYILNHSEAKILFIENDKVLEKFNKVKAKTSVKTIVMMDSKAKGESGIIKLSDLIEKGKKLEKADQKKLKLESLISNPDDLFTLIYTSGTTGQPKGVMLMHSNAMHQLIDVAPLMECGSSDRFLSILPVWHIFERAFM
jgi:long-chain acyl-CoA synthetase